MLRDLHVRNLAVIAEAEIEFGPGLNVLTGETGAGKSIVVDSLALLSGARASSDLIRSDAPALSVTGIFEPRGEAWRSILAAAGIDSVGEELSVRREISREGRNKVFLNDQPATLNLLATLAPEILRIHTQREELGLVSSELQRAWLDRSAGADAEQLARSVGESFDAYTDLATRLERAAGSEQLRQERIDLLGFQIGELDAARVQAGEDRDLRAERERLRHAETIVAALGSSYGALFEQEGAASERVAQAARKLQEIAEWEPAVEDWTGALESTRVTLEDLAGELRQHLERIEVDPSRLGEVEERLAILERLTHKYGRDCAGLTELRREMAEELDDLTADESLRHELTQQAQEALNHYSEVAGTLSQARRVWGRSLEERVHQELAELALGKARFAVTLGQRRRDDSPLQIEGMPVEFSSHGFDRVTYRLAANPGEDPAPLSQSASGGELSRIYLAVQLAIRASGPAATSTLVFDEVDAGIGGAEASALGDKLGRLARGGQILVVTHLPQVACFGDRHFRVEKRVSRGRTLTRVVPLTDKSRVEEVARMLAGSQVTELSLSHAQEMIASAVGDSI